MLQSVKLGFLIYIIGQKFHATCAANEQLDAMGNFCLEIYESKFSQNSLSHQILHSMYVLLRGKFSILKWFLDCDETLLFSKDFDHKLFEVVNVKFWFASVKSLIQKLKFELIAILFSFDNLVSVKRFVFIYFLRQQYQLKTGSCLT